MVAVVIAVGIRHRRGWGRVGDQSLAMSGLVGTSSRSHVFRGLLTKNLRAARQSRVGSWSLEPYGSSKRESRCVGQVLCLEE